MSSSSDITSFFTGRSIFITGGTGLLGKALIEKLLRSCPDLKRIYVLIRPKKGEEPTDRLDNLFSSVYFSVLKEQSPEVFHKVVPVFGDVTVDGLGLTSTAKNILCEQVSVIFHCAAVVRFDQPIKPCIDVNLTSVKRIIDLARQTSHLEALIHVSTAFCTFLTDHIAEKLYEPPADPNKIIALVEAINDSTAALITPSLLGNIPTTYHYAKALAEDLVGQEFGKLPVSIVRPSIVVGTWKEPFLGYVDSVHGPAGVSVAVGQGIVHSFVADATKTVDYVPLDAVVNTLLAAAWDTVHKQSGSSVPIYNLTTSTLHPIKWGDYLQWALHFNRMSPFDNIMWYPSCVFFTNNAAYAVVDFFVHYIPAIAMDFVRKSQGKKPIMKRIYQKMSSANTTLQYFTMREWKFTNDNLLSLWEKMSSKDREVFYFDVWRIDWKAYCGHCITGAKRFMMQESLDNIDAAKTRLKRFYWLHVGSMVFVGALLLLLACFIWTRITNTLFTDI